MSVSIIRTPAFQRVFPLNIGYSLQPHSITPLAEETVGKRGGSLNLSADTGVLPYRRFL